MPHLIKRIVPLIVLGFTATAAQASGGVTCSVDDGQATIEAGAVLAHGVGAYLSNPQGSLVIKAASIPQDMRKWDLKDGLVHHWMAGGETKLHYYFERAGSAAFASIELIIDTKDDPESEGSKGTYTIHSFDMTPPADKEGGKTVDLSGPIECLLE